MVTLALPRAPAPIVPVTLTLPDAVADESIVEAWKAQEVRRIAREPHPRSGPQPRCVACCRFKGQEHAPCPCGFTPGQGYAA